MERTKPTFSLTGFVPLEIKRGSPDKIVNGRPVKGEVEIIVLEKANVQPLKFREIMSLPEVERTKEWIKVYSDECMRSLLETEDGYQADVILWQGKEWRVEKSHQYQMGVLDHWVSYAARLPEGAGYAV